MKGVNKVILVGNLGKDPEVQYLENNLCIAKFSLATSDSYKDKDGNRVDQTEWHNVVLWRGLAEVAEKYLKKGSRIYLEGKFPAGFRRLQQATTDLMDKFRSMNYGIDYAFINPNEGSKEEQNQMREKLKAYGIFPTRLSVVDNAERSA